MSFDNGPKSENDTRFKPGNPGGPGRPRGARNKLGEDFIKALADDFDQHGVAVIQEVRATDPVQYVKVIAGILPKELNVQINPLDEMTDAELIDRIRQLDAAISAATGTGGTQGGSGETIGGDELRGLRPH